MNVLVACEESQTVTKCFRDIGDNAFSCDIDDCSGGHPEWHIKRDVLQIINGNCSFYTMDDSFHTIVGEWDIVIGFPPCTYLSNAGACRLYPHKGEIDMDRYYKGLLAKEFFMSLYNCSCNKIAIENPVSSKIYNMPPYTQEIQPWQFGHPYTKKTRLWLKNLPELLPTDIVTPISSYVPSHTSSKDRNKYGSAKRGEDSKNRAKTFVGIAKAMSYQWGSKNNDNKK